MPGYIDQAAIDAITAILKRGNDAVVRRKGGGVVILEEIRKIKHSTASIGKR